MFFDDLSFLTEGDLCMKVCMCTGCATFSVVKVSSNVAVDTQRHTIRYIYIYDTYDTYIYIYIYIHDTTYDDVFNCNWVATRWQ